MTLIKVIFWQCIDKQLSSLGQLFVQKLIFRIPLRKGNEEHIHYTQGGKLCQVSAKKIFHTGGIHQ